MTNLRTQQLGVYSVEFVLVAGFFFLLLFSVMEVGKVMYFFSTANESTRRAARLAAVCDKNDPAIKSVVTDRLPFATSENISIRYCGKNEPNCLCDGTFSICDKADCQLITVCLNNAIYTSSIVPISVTLPAFATTIPRESMDSSFNADCS